MLGYLLIFATAAPLIFGFPPEHLDHVVHDYAQDIENLKRTARDIKFIDNDGDVIKIVKTEPLIVKGKLVVLDRSEIVRIRPPPPKYIEVASIEVEDSDEDVYVEEYIEADDGDIIIEDDDFKLCKYVKVYRKKY